MLASLDFLLRGEELGSKLTSLADIHMPNEGVNGLILLSNPSEPFLGIKSILQFFQLGIF